MRHWVLVVATLGGGCAAEVDSTIDITHDPCAPLALSAPTASALQLDAVGDAIGLWRERGATGFGRRASAPSTIAIDFEQADGALLRGLYDDEAGIIYVNPALDERAVIALVVAHELGHSFGLEHVPAEERPSLMNPGNLVVAPTAEDQRALEARWGRCGD